MKFVIINDVHLSDRPPSIRTAAYGEEILAKLDFAVNHAKSIGADAILQCGDLFHIKAPSRTSHELVQSTHEVLTSSGLPVIIVPGNHDMQHDRISSLDGQPLGALCRMRGVEMLIGPHRDLPIFGLPYLARWAEQLPEWMERYFEWASQYHPGSENPTIPLMLTHAPIFPDGTEPPYDFITASDWAELMQVGACHYGHIHDPHGYYTPDKSMPVVLGNPGALSRGSLHEATLRRKPAITEFDSSRTLETVFERIEVPHKPIEEVFAMAARREAESEQARLSEFLEGIGTDTIEVSSTESARRYVEGLDVSRETKAAVVELIEHAEAK